MLTPLSAFADESPALGGIVPHELAKHLRFLAADELKGRDTGTPEAREAANYLGEQLRKFGIEPGGDPLPAGRTRSYFAEFPLVRSELDLDTTNLSIEVTLGEVKRTIHLSAARDFLMSTRGLTAGDWNGELVFVGAGRARDYAGQDLAGKFALAMEPKAEQRGRRRGRFTGMRALRTAAREAGALGLLVLQSTAEPEKTYRELMPWLGSRPQTTRLSLDADDDSERGLPVAFLEAPARAFLFDSEKLSDSTPLGPLSGVRAQLAVAGEVEKIAGRNVVGILPGSDPKRSREVVVISAHYDHVGVRDDGEVYNGADDNASGTSAVIEMAQAFSEGPRPKRTVVFLWVSGEEKGLLGSRWWVDHPTLPEGSTIVANVNLDMVGRNETGSVSLCPSPKHASHSTLTELAKAACEAESYRAQFDADQYFERTDSYNFARRGIPIVFFHSGDHPDYHRVTDTVDKINFKKASDITRIAFRVAWEAANLDDPPRVLRK